MTDMFTNARQAVRWPGSLIRPALSLQRALSGFAIETAFRLFRTFSP